MLRPTSGLNLYEFTIVVVLFSLLTGVFLHRFRAMQEYTEKVAMDMTVMNIRTGLRYQLAELALTGKPVRVSDVLLVNPVIWLERPPANYAGEVSDPAGADIQPGFWYFDLRHKQLVYRLNLHANFDGQTEAPEIRYQMTASAAEGVRRPAPEEVAPLMTGLGLKKISLNQWFGE